MKYPNQDRIQRFAGSTLVAAALAATPILATAQENGEGEAEMTADRLMELLEETLANAQSITFEEATVLRVAEMGDMEMIQGRMNFAANRPNQMRIDLFEGPAEDPILVVASDGETTTQHYTGDGPTGPVNIYDQVESAETIEDAITMSPFLGSVSLTLFSEPGSFKNAFGPTTEFEYAGTEEAENGEENHKLTFSVPGQMDGEVLTTTGDKPLLEAVKISQMQGQDVDVAFQFSNWSIDEPTPAMRFQYSPPANAEEVPSLIQTLSQPAAPPQQQAPPPDAPPQQAPPQEAPPPDFN